MSLVRVQSEEPELEKPAQGNPSGLFAFLFSVRASYPAAPPRSLYRIDVAQGECVIAVLSLKGDSFDERGRQCGLIIGEA
ncbi:hypothetical protein [Pantoea sp.]|uniref:hypothetical protein n=1 Tax=Pantoea sp. TaxID=69393 RepID=UPI0028AF4394|nr:hypothetical protein [Pantoea sp.]